MRIKIAALVAALAIPALGWAASSTLKAKDRACPNCPFSSCPLKR
ncbi:MAG: hypothetical protein ACM3PC_07700 [Deltaproteobacteria bacterium]